VHESGTRLAAILHACAKDVLHGPQDDDRACMATGPTVNTSVHE
jgi:hypothetical protein